MKLVKGYPYILKPGHEDYSEEENYMIYNGISKDKKYYSFFFWVKWNKVWETHKVEMNITKGDLDIMSGYEKKTFIKNVFIAKEWVDYEK